MRRASTRKRTKRARSSCCAPKRARYVISDWELPFRNLARRNDHGTLPERRGLGTGVHADYYEVLYRRQGGGWIPVWMFREPYYRSMAFRLSVLGGAGATPVNSTTLINVADHADSRGLQFREIVSEQTVRDIRSRAARTRCCRTFGDDCRDGSVARRVSRRATRSLVEVHAVRTHEQKPSEAPWVRVFSVR